MAVAITKIKGMPASIAAVFQDNGVYNSEQFVDVLRKPIFRRALAEVMEVEPTVLLRLASRADLARVPGVGVVYAELLEAAGITSVRELGQAHPQRLRKRLVNANRSQPIAFRFPDLQTIREWVKRASCVPQVIEH